MSIDFVAPSKVYLTPRSSSSERTELAGYAMGEPLGLAKTKTGGLATWFQGHPFPRKTFIYSGITEPNNKAKRITLSLFLPFASLRHGIKAFLNSYFLNYNRLIESIYDDCDQRPYLHYQYYSEFGKSLWDFSYLFLKKLGIKDNIAYRTGLYITTMIEYDDAYKAPLQDILNESSKEALLENPRKEITRLVEIYKSRTLTWGKGDESTAGEKFIRMAKLLNYLLYILPIKKAFKFALENINFDWFKYDEWDEYWTLNRGDYNCSGLTFEERKAKMLDIMLKFAEKIHPGKKSKIVDEDGITKIVTT